MARWSTEPALPQAELFGERDGVFGAAAPDLLFERLGIAPGIAHQARQATFELRARLVTEPDAVSDGFGFAPRLMVSLEGLARFRPDPARQPGRICLQGPASRQGQARPISPRSATAPEQQFPEAGWSIRTRSNAAPSLSANIERFSQFLTLVGLTALVVGGVGVANAVRAYLDGKRGVIATFKSLGASGGFVFTVYLVQILIIAGIGIADRPGARRADAVRRQRCAVLGHPGAGRRRHLSGALGMAALFGLLVTLAFALLPLGRARDVPATALFREMGFEASGLPRRIYVAAALGLAVAARAARDLVLRRPAHRLDLRRRHDLFLHRAAQRRPARPVAREKEPARALRRAQAGHRQHPPARRADAVGRAVARARADACWSRWR